MDPDRLTSPAAAPPLAAVAAAEGGACWVMWGSRTCPGVDFLDGMDVTAGCELALGDIQGFRCGLMFKV